MSKRGVGQATVLVVVTAVCLFLSLAVLSDLAIYRRSGIFHGEYWRLITGNLVHLNWQHLSLNLAAWVLVWVYGTRVCSVTVWLLSLLFCAAGVGVGILLSLPQLEMYSGLSGILHGLFVVVAGLRLMERRDDYSAWSILLVITLKLFSEVMWGAHDATTDWVGLRVVTQAHLYGGLSGLVLVVCFWGGRVIDARR